MKNFRKIASLPFLAIGLLFTRIAEWVSGDTLAYRAEEVRAETMAELSQSPGLARKGFRVPGKKKGVTKKR